MGAIKPFYGEGLKFWSDELARAICKNDNDKIQECIKALVMFVKDDNKK